MGLYDFFWVHPSFTALITENTEKEAIRIATHMQSMLFKAEFLASKDDIPADFTRHVKDLQRDFDFIKVKVFFAVRRSYILYRPKSHGICK